MFEQQLGNKMLKNLQLISSSRGVMNKECRCCIDSILFDELRYGAARTCTNWRGDEEVSATLLKRSYFPTNCDQLNITTNEVLDPLSIDNVAGG
jgi:hypothetical protein